MNYNQKAFGLGSKRSIIREIFEYSKVRGAEIGAENVFDFSLGNPSVEPPIEVTQAIKDLINTESPTALHGYTSAQGDLLVRKAVAENINKRFNLNLTPDYIYMTCGAAASLSICLKAVINDGDECVVFAPFFTEYRVFVENAGAKLVVSKPSENTFQIDISDLESKITENTKALILNSPNNPSGVVYTEETIKAVCSL
ncbi:MAG: aminotransferase class I/II-fold pyridoxal phosphate-dependent enzyme, partial [Clostridia bacterium]|nr:aminotransferase class I/II-fold pyridoxal phosphate-dependent enzyme [Clostridia bacterium]